MKTQQSVPATVQEGVDLMVAKAQIRLAYLFVIGIFALIFVLIFFHGTIVGTALTIITSVIASLLTVLTLQQNYFFARQRPVAPGQPQPPSAPTLTGVFNDGSSTVSASAGPASARVSVQPSPPGAPGI